MKVIPPKYINDKRVAKIFIFTISKKGLVDEKKVLRTNR